jgi:hypothetical protein
MTTVDRTVTPPVHSSITKLGIAGAICAAMTPTV